MVVTVEECVRRMEAGFWRRYNANPELQRKLAGKTRVIQLAIAEGEGWWFHIHDGKLDKVEQGHHPEPDAVVTTSREDILAIFNGQLKAMNAFLMGRVKVKASFGDIVFAKSLIG